MEAKHDLTVVEARETAPAPVSSADALMRIIDRAVNDPSFDVDKLSKLLDMKERWEANEARKAYIEAKAAFKAEAPKLERNKHVDYSTQKGRTEYYHATLDYIAGSLSPVLSRHGLSYGWSTEQSDGMVAVTCEMTHIMGHSEKVTLKAAPDTTGSKNSIQAIGSTVSYLQRYTLLAIAGMSTGDMDDDGRQADLALIDAAQKAEIVALMKETNADTGKFLKYLGVPSLDDLPAKHFEQAIAALAKKRSAA